MKLPVLFQRVEGAAMFAAATFVYFHSGFGWLAYILLLFAFDASMLGYLLGPRVGAIIYNTGHSVVLPALLVVLYVLVSSDLLLALVCLWFAHIGVDRALGYGLKLPSGFKHTHLGDIGKG